MATSSSPFHLSSALKFSLKPTHFPSFNLHFRTSRRRFISLSSPISSSTFFCCCSSSSTTKGKNADQSAELNFDKSSDLGVVIPVRRNSNEFDDCGEYLSVNKLETESLEDRISSVKGDLGGRSFWRRIFSASKKFRSIILLNAITVIYASNIPVVKEVEGLVHPEVFTAVRFVFAAIPFLPFVIKARDDIQMRKAGLELGFWISLAYLMQALGLLTSDAGRASFISMFTVVVVPFLDGILGSVIPIYTWFGALMSLVGVGMLESSGSPPCVGDFLNFLSAVFFGVHMLRTEHISRSITRDNFLPLLGYEICIVAFSSIMWCIIGGYFGGTPPYNLSLWTPAEFWNWMVAFPWIPAFYTGFFSTGLCLWIEMSAMRDVSATETAIIYGLEPVWGAAFAWFLLGERWGAKGWIGAAFVLGGSSAVQLCGLSSPASSRKDKRSLKQNDDLIALDNQKDLSTSSVVVNASNDPRSL